MRRSKVEVYLHIVWGTMRRAPLLTPLLEPQVHRVIRAEGVRLNCTVYEVNGMADHVHVVIRIPSTLSVAKLAQQLKGVSSNFVNDHFRGPDVFRWHEGYAAFSVSRSHLQRVIDYVRNQKRHHADGSTWTEWEEIDEATVAPDVGSSNPDQAGSAESDSLNSGSAEPGSAG